MVGFAMIPVIQSYMEPPKKGPRKIDGSSVLKARQKSS
jgi:hypothetical protein